MNYWKWQCLYLSQLQICESAGTFLSEDKCYISFPGLCVYVMYWLRERYTESQKSTITSGIDCQTVIHTEFLDIKCRSLFFQKVKVGFIIQEENWDFLRIRFFFF